MEEKILQTKKNGMTMLLTLLGYAGLWWAASGFVMLYASPSWVYPAGDGCHLCHRYFPTAGLKVPQAQEALVLTLFGDYIGT